VPRVSTPGLRPLRVGEILDVAVKLYLGHAGTLFRIVLVVVVPVQVLAVLVSAATTPEDLETGLGPLLDPEAEAGADLESAELATYFAGQGAVLLLNALVVAVGVAACFKAISDAYLGAHPDWRASLGFVARRLAPVLWVSVLASVVPALALLAFIVPGVWLWVAWSVAVPALLFEEARGGKALARSFRLVRHRWWPTFGALMVGFVLATLAATVVAALVVGAFTLAAGDSGPGGLIGEGLGSTISAVLATPFQAAVVALIYFDLRVRKEGFDLERLAGGLGAGRGGRESAGVGGGAVGAGGGAPVEWLPPVPPSGNGRAGAGSSGTEPPGGWEPPDGGPGGGERFA
jgi:hypothetical protein